MRGSISCILSGPAFSSIVLEDFDLRDEGSHVGQILIGLENGLEVVELNRSQALSWTLVEQERVVVQ